MLVCGGEADVDRQHPELLQHFQDARFRRDRQREQHEIDAGAAGEFDDVVDLAELARAGAGIERAAVVAVVEHAQHVDVGILLRFERFDQLLAVAVGADDDGAAVEPALARPAAHQRSQHQTLGKQRGEPEEIEGGKPQPRDFAAVFGEEGDADEQQEDERPGRDHPCHLPELTAEQLHLIDVGGLEADHGCDRYGDDLGGIDPAEAGERHDVADIERDTDEAEQREVGHAHEAGDHDRRIGAGDLLVDDVEGCGREPAAALHEGLVSGFRRGTGRGIEHRACVERFHGRPRPFQAPAGQWRWRPGRHPPVLRLSNKSEDFLKRA
ncbi:hypothetical protein ABH977_006676 [Bradyrhizobium ottawaense]